MMRFIKKGVLGGSVVVLLTIFGSASSAFALSPWWHLASGSRPSTIQPGVARDEVRKLTVQASAGAYVLEEPALIKEGVIAEGVSYVFLPFDASAAEIEVGLDALYGLGNVEVTETGVHEFNIAFKGTRSDQPVGLTDEGEVTLSEVTGGRADGQIIVSATNLGDANASGETTPISIVDRLPAGLKATAIKGQAVEGGGGGSTSLGPVTCVLGSLTCTFSSVVYPHAEIEVAISVVSQGATDGETNEVIATGGNVAKGSLNRPVTVGSGPSSFGVEDYELAPEEEGGTPDTQAGSHMFQLTTTMALNQTVDARPVALAKDLHFKLPTGLVGNATAIAQCTLKNFVTPRPGEASENLCSPQTVVGVATITAYFGNEQSVNEYMVPVFNLTPGYGEPARFGFFILQTPVVLDTAVRTGEDYGVTVNVSNITQTVAFLKSEVTFWGTPGDPRHDAQRGWGCLYDNGINGPRHPQPCSPLEATNPSALLSLPTSCSGPLRSSVEADSWADPGSFGSFDPNESLVALDGCNRLPFHPSVSVAPDGQAASTPTGLTVTEHVPQEGSLTSSGLSEADVKDTSVALPAGVTLNPAAADGLEACSEGQVGLSVNAPVSCPEAAKVGTVEIDTPLLPEPIQGAVYLAAQTENPFGSLVALYIVGEDPEAGIIVKVAGEVRTDPVTGQVVGTFNETPQLPFEDLKLHFFGGSRAPLGTPASCGSYTTAATIAPWSGNPSTGSSSSFDVISGPNGSPCAVPLPFNPTLTAGTSSIQAGGFSPFTMTMSKVDGEQSLQAIELKTPAGLSGLLSSVELCPEPQADEGLCGPRSLIGETTVSVGLGGDPFSVKGGRVYITGPYEGAPFGLSIVNPAKAGPFDLENTQSNHPACDCVLVRAKIEVNPITATLTVTSDNSGPYKIPTIVEGIPLQIKHVNVTVNRPSFIFNPTNCDKMEIGGTLSSAEGASKTLSVPFQATNCAVLKFAPKFAVSTSGKTSKSQGASLTANLSYPSAPPGTQANITRVKVDLPKQLPSRLTTLQKACTNAQFEKNPANCPKESKIGFAKVTTPLLPVPLEGPAIFVSHGGEAFPSLTMVLQGYGVTVNLVGTTFISKAGITSTTFKQVPDVPFNTFTLTLPQGKFSALAANGDLCTSKLTMPTEFVAQNGLKINQSTNLAVTGCAKAKALTRPQKLTKALKACKTKKNKTKRAGCEKTARKQYGPLKKQAKQKRSK